MEKGTIRIKLKRHKRMPFYYVSLEANGTDELMNMWQREGMLALLDGLGIRKIEALLHWNPESSSLIEKDGWIPADGDYLVLCTPELTGPLTRLMEEAQRHRDCAELRLTTQTGTLEAIVNDNDEYWLILGDCSAFSEDWLVRCKEKMPNWTFKISRGAWNFK
jgi:hypothetical protein